MCSVVYCSYLLTATVIVQIPFVVWISGIRDIVTTTQDTRVTLQYNTEDNELVCKYTERYYVLTDIAKRSNNGLDSSLKDGWRFLAGPADAGLLCFVLGEESSGTFTFPIEQWLLQW